jgi:hypothetical protein
MWRILLCATIKCKDNRKVTCLAISSISRQSESHLWYVYLLVVSMFIPYIHAFRVWKDEDKVWIGKHVEGSSRSLILSYSPGLCREGLRKTTKPLSHDSRSPGRDLNPGPLEYEAGLLAARPYNSRIGFWLSKPWRVMKKRAHYSKTEGKKLGVGNCFLSGGHMGLFWSNNWLESYPSCSSNLVNYLFLYCTDWVYFVYYPKNEIMLVWTLENIIQ